MRTLVARILASAAQRMWQVERNLGRYTADTAEREWNLAFHYAVALRQLIPWLDCDVEVAKPNFRNDRPDIIFHRRTIHRLNFLVVEAKRWHDIEGANDDLRKIRNEWFTGNLQYRFGASVILDERHRTFNVRLLERDDQNFRYEIASGVQFQSVNTPRFSRIRRQTFLRIVDRAAQGPMPQADFDTAIFRLYGINP